MELSPGGRARSRAKIHQHLAAAQRRPSRCSSAALARHSARPHSQLRCQLRDIDQAGLRERFSFGYVRYWTVCWPWIRFQRRSRLLLMLLTASSAAALFRRAGVTVCSFQVIRDHDHPINRIVWDQQPAVIQWTNLSMKRSCQTPAWTDVLPTLLAHSCSGVAHREQLRFSLLASGSNGESLLAHNVPAEHPISSASWRRALML